MSRDDILPMPPDGRHHVFTELTRFAFAKSRVLGPAQGLDKCRREIEIEGETLFLKLFADVAIDGKCEGHDLADMGSHRLPTNGIPQFRHAGDCLRDRPSILMQAAEIKHRLPEAESRLDLLYREYIACSATGRSVVVPTRRNHRCGNWDGLVLKSEPAKNIFACGVMDGLGGDQRNAGAKTLRTLRGVVRPLNHRDLVQIR